jgi:AraC-like DNA-binding protein
MVVYELSMTPPLRFTFAGVTHALPGYVHMERRSLYQAEFFLVEKGTLCMECDGEQVAAGPGEVIFHPAGCHQRGWKPSARGAVFVWVHFVGRVRRIESGASHMTRIRGAMVRAASTPSARPTRVYIPGHARPAHFAEMLEAGYRLAERGMRLSSERDALLQILLGRLALSCFGGDAPGTRNPAQAAVERVKYWIDKRIDRPTTVAEIASHVRMNADYMNRLFRRHTGLTVRDFLRMRKLERSRHLLASGVSVKEAAHGAGFADPAYFSRKFKRFAGVPPSAYGRMASDLARN